MCLSSHELTQTNLLLFFSSFLTSTVSHQQTQQIADSLGQAHTQLSRFRSRFLVCYNASLFFYLHYTTQRATTIGKKMFSLRLRVTCYTHTIINLLTRTPGQRNELNQMSRPLACTRARDVILWRHNNQNFGFFQHTTTRPVAGAYHHIQTKSNCLQSCFTPSSNFTFFEMSSAFPRKVFFWWVVGVGGR